MNKSCGFSLIELIIVLTLIGIIAAFSSSAYRNYLSASEFESQAQILWSELSVLRVESIKMNVPFIVTLDGTSGLCNIYTDLDRDGIADDDELHGTHTLPAGITFSNTRPEAAPDPPSVSAVNWLDDNIYLTNNGIVGINEGKFYLLCTKVNNKGYCFMRATNSLMLELLKWDGSQWKNI